MTWLWNYSLWPGEFRSGHITKDKAKRGTVGELHWGLQSTPVSPNHTWASFLWFSPLSLSRMPNTCLNTGGFHILDVVVPLSPVLFQTSCKHHIDKKPSRSQDVISCTLVQPSLHEDHVWHHTYFPTLSNLVCILHKFFMLPAHQNPWGLNSQ